MCSICGFTKCHSRCPNYESPKTYHYCSVCREGITNGEEYIMNEDGEYRHLDCFCGIVDLLEWLGYEIKTMDDKYERVIYEQEI